MGLSTFVKGAMLRHLFANQNIPEPTSTLYVAALDADGKEITGIGYKRIAVSTGVHKSGQASAWQVDDASVSNRQALSFPVAKSDWGTVSYCAVYDAITEGNCLFTAPNRKALNVQEQDQLVIEPGALSLKVL